MPAPAPVPALPDTERLTSYAINAQTGPFDVGFAVYGDGTDYVNWLQVFLDGVELVAVTDWTVDLATGTLAESARPLQNARVTLTVASTGTLDIVGKRRPRRLTQFSENQGVGARDLNLALTDLAAQNREAWDTVGAVIATQRVLATQAEAVAGVENTHYMSPLRTKQAIDPAIATKVSRAGDAMTGPLSLSGNPVQSLDAASKQYVDSFASGLVIKDSVAAATTANITLSGIQTIDGVASPSDVLVKNQTTPAQNGIYVPAAGAWTRRSDLDTWSEAIGSYTFVRAGSVNGSTGWVSQATAGGTIGVTVMPWAQFTTAAGAVPLAGGTMTGLLILSGNPVAALGAVTKQYSDLKVAKTGDTMTGPLSMSINTFIGLNSPTPDANSKQIIGYVNSLPRWDMFIGDATPETGGNAGSDFSIIHFSDAGAPLGNAIKITRADGRVSLNGDPTAALHAATKQYVDTAGMSANVMHYGALGDGTADDWTNIQNLINAVSAAGGGIVFFPPGKTYKITQTLTVNASHVKLIGVGGETTHDYPASPIGSRLLWAGAAGGTMVRFATLPGGLTTTLITGCEMQGFYLDANNLAGTCLHIRSARNGILRHVFSFEPTIQANLWDCLVAGVDTAEAADNQQWYVSQCNFRCLNTPAASGWVLDGSSTSNTSLNTFEMLSGYHRGNSAIPGNGCGFVIKNADTNTFCQCVPRRTLGDGWSFDNWVAGAAGAGSVVGNMFYDCAWNSFIIRGSEQAGFGGINNIANTIGYFDEYNGSPLPVLGTGSSYRMVARAWAPCTVAQLPVVATFPSQKPGQRGFVTDATSVTFGAIVAGGGGNSVPVYCDGTNWKIG